MTSTPPDNRRIRIGIDTGGTFTDVVAIDESTGALVSTKTPSTPADPAEGFMVGVHKVLDELGLGGGDVSAVSHGTTVATNALLEDRLDDLGFITNQGYRYVLEIARQSVPDGYGNSYFWVKPPRIVPVHLVKEVGGRLDHTGVELEPFDEEGAAAVARWFRDRGINTVGVCFLHAYAEPSHEQRMREVLVREHPECTVSISSDVLREYREYERSVTTLVDAAVKPRVTRYISEIKDRLDGFTAREGDERHRIPFYIMKSNGGVLSADEVVRQPITTVLSGPAAGALGAATVAAKAGYDRLLTLDGGGTSTDVSVVLGGEPTLTTEGSVGRYPSKIPMIDIVTVGAGGGSIAWVSPEGNLKVGPRSAGADPGPICYGQGGDEPTLTDANVVLGRIPPHLLGGEIPLDVDAAREGLERLAGRVDLGLEQLTTGILEISAWNQANAIRQITVKRGLDVREFAMAAFGGSGPLSSCRLIDILGIEAVVVPPDPGNLSAYGLLTVDVKNDYVQTHVRKHADLDLAEVAAVYEALEQRAAETLRREGFDDEEHRYERSADLRYDGQAFEVRVSAPSGQIDRAFADAVVASFHEAHEALYDYAYRDDPRHGVEWVNLRVSGVGPIRRPTLAAEPAGAPTSPAPVGSRRTHFGAWTDAAVHWRPDLSPGARVVGPAVIEEFGSTLPVQPGFSASVDGYRNLIVTKDLR
ncbi:MAG: hydantoinase/oxoprolinase family protein [Nitriliruptorales bacterium]|nr:hydantoinase/oxoprolinase family protein [Nitriliruptorales bacterium]